MLTQKELCYRRYSGAGNTFLLIDKRDAELELSSEAVQKLCSSPRPSDGVILLEHSRHADLKMRIFNADGGEAEMCGNGVRCLYRFAQDLELIDDDEISLETLAGPVQIWDQGDFVGVGMPQATEDHWHLRLKVEDQDFEGHFINTGVPHLVLPVASVASFPLDTIAPQLATPCELWPQSTNVNIYEVLQDQKIRLRTFERGVGETLACGTGATASALIYAKLQGAGSPVEVQVASGDSLLIGFDLCGDNFSQVTLSGPARFLQAGSLKL